MRRRAGSANLLMGVSAALFFFSLSFPLAAIAQTQPGGVNTRPAVQDFSTAYITAPGTGIIVVTVFSQNSSVHLDRQAVAKLVNLAAETATWQTTEEKSQAVFTNVPFGRYDLQVSAVGYLADHKEVDVLNLLHPLQVDIVLHRDPEAINLNVASAALPSKARKETKHAISALKSGNLKGAQKQLDEAYKLAPSSPDLNFLLGYLYFQKRDFAQAGKYLDTATNLSPQDEQALTLLGRVELERADYPVARAALEKAVLVDAQNWLPRNLLADTYLRQRQYEMARDQARIAIEQGTSQASPAQVVLGEALIGLGKDQEGLEALNVFLRESPQNPIAPRVRRLVAELQDHGAEPVQREVSQPAPAHPLAIDPLLAVADPGLSVRTWQPPGIDAIRPSLALGVSCPSEKVIDGSGERVKQLVDDVSRFAAVEDLLHQNVDEYGSPIRTETRKFNYVASIAESEPGFLAVSEYRADKMDLKGYPDQIASTGFAALALVFHPVMRANFELTCEGLGSWHEQATWLVRFRQRDDRPIRIHSYKVGDRVYPVRLKGRAWITADNFQIVRIESELVNPIPEILLRSEHQIVEYGPVPFPKRNAELWLPKSADIYFDFRKHRYYRRHSFDHYMLFSVDSQDKAKEPTPASRPTP